MTAKQWTKGEIGLDGHSLPPAQSRMARAALLWSLHEAASAAGLSYRTILRFEKEQRDVHPEVIADLRRAYEAAGVRFIEEATTRAASSRRRSAFHRHGIRSCVPGIPK